jgi:hypothetical protein
MKIEQLSPHGYHISQVFTDDRLNELIQLVDTFTPTVVKQSGNGVGYREDYSIAQTFQYRVIAQQIFDDLRTVCPDIKHIVSSSLWRDYPGYVNSDHYDDPALANIMIVYLGTGNNSINGTRWFEDNTEYSVPYEINTGLILLNTPQVLHGMIGTVENMDYRRSLYVNW